MQHEESKLTQIYGENKVLLSTVFFAYYFSPLLIMSITCLYILL